MRNFIFFFTLLLIQSPAVATSFQPVSIKKQIQESSGIIEGEVVSITPVYDEQDNIITKVTFLANSWLSLIHI